MAEPGRKSLQPVIKESSSLHHHVVSKKHIHGGTSHLHDPITIRNPASSNHQLRTPRAKDPHVIPAPDEIKERANSLPSREALLPPIKEDSLYTLVLDLDETLVHFEAKSRCFKVRPYAIKFLREMSKYYEICIFTAAL